MNVYTYKGEGKYLQSTAVVIAKNIDEASDLIYERLQDAGLDMNGETTEHEIIKPEVVTFWDGDY